MDKDGQNCVLLIKVLLEEHNSGTLFLEGSLSLICSISFYSQFATKERAFTPHDVLAFIKFYFGGPTVGLFSKD